MRPAPLVLVVGLIAGGGCVVGTAATADAGAPDASVPDGGPLPDAGPLPDGGSLPDAGPLPDGGSLPDAGPLPDGGPTADGGSVGAGKSTYTCPAGGIDIRATDDAAARINGADAGAILCVHGAHYLSATVSPKANQQIIGVDANARLSGAQPLTGWKTLDAGIWYYDGPFAATQHTSDGNLGGGKVPCFCVSTYQDDVFYDDQRMMRVMSLSQLTGAAALPPGQAVTQGEIGRFFFDGAGQRIYVNLDPTGHTLDLAVLDTVVLGAFGGDHVQLTNLFLEKGRSNILCYGGTYCSYAKSWKLTDCTVRFAHNVGVQGGAGLSADDRVTYLRTLISENGQFGVGSGGTWQLFQDSELSWNNIANYRALNTGTACDTGTCGGYWGAGACKFVLTYGTPTDAGLLVVNLDSHHNLGPGFWTDVRNRYTTVQGGRLHDNEGSGYDHEISCDLDLNGVEIDHNGVTLKNADHATLGGAGVSVNDSNYAVIRHNVIHDNLGPAVALDWQQSHTGLCMSCLSALDAGCDGDTTTAMMHARVTSNAVYTCGSTWTGTLYGTWGLTSRDDLFTANAYHVPSATGDYWRDTGLETWASWAITQDDGGTVSNSCTYP